MNIKRTITLIIAAIWIILCAFSVFSSELIAQPLQSNAKTSTFLGVSRSDLERISAESFDNMTLAELLNIVIEVIENENIVLIEKNLSFEKTSLFNASSDFMHEVLPYEQLQFSTPQQNQKSPNVTTQKKHSLNTIVEMKSPQSTNLYMKNTSFGYQK